LIVSNYYINWRMDHGLFMRHLFLERNDC